MPASAPPRIPPAAASRAAGSIVLGLPGGEPWRSGEGEALCSLGFTSERQRQQAIRGELYATAMAFVRGEIQCTGDIVAAVGFFTRRVRDRPGPIPLILARLLRAEAWWQSRRRAAQNVRRHYDRSNEFYRQFLDRTMTYSCAYFRDPGWGLDQAQEAKIEHVLRKLDVRPGERFLDIGSGWGALVRTAARMGAIATGCTLSPSQFEWSRQDTDGGQPRPAFVLADYRDLSGEWEKIASVGMFEHVGRWRLAAYFRKVHGLLRDSGLFLNHGLARPCTVPEGAESVFLRKMVFPGTEVPRLPDLVTAAEQAGFEVLDVENLRPHYALTCRAWVANLQRNSEAAIRATDPETYRTWLLYLAGCAVHFEAGELEVHQMLLAKRSRPLPRRLSRAYMYGGESAVYTG